MHDLQSLVHSVLSHHELRSLPHEQDSQKLDTAIHMVQPLQHLQDVSGGRVAVLGSKVCQVLKYLQRLGNVRETLVSSILVLELLTNRKTV